MFRWLFLIDMHILVTSKTWQDQQLSYVHWHGSKYWIPSTLKQFEWTRGQRRYCKATNYDVGLCVVRASVVTSKLRKLKKLPRLAKTKTPFEEEFAEYICEVVLVVASSWSVDRRSKLFSNWCYHVWGKYAQHSGLWILHLVECGTW